MTHQTALAAKVAARNNVNARLRALAQSFFNVCRPFVGKKIKTTSGEFTQAFRAALAPLTGEPNGEFWQSSTYSLARTFKVSEQGPRTCHYAEAVLYIGDIDGQTLASVQYADKFNPDAFRVDFTEIEVTEARRQVKAAREALQKAESKLSYFGEHDNN